MKLLAGVFVGGESRRMGGRPKGLLEAPEGGTIAARTLAMVHEVADEVVLVGASEAYGALGARAIDDAAPGCGPLGGLVSLLAHAGDRDALVVACDMPRVTLALTKRLAMEHAGAPALAPRFDDRWSPLFARYSPKFVLPVARTRLDTRALSLQPLLDAVGAKVLDVDDEERRALVDWDTPEDIGS